MAKLLDKIKFLFVPPIVWSVQRKVRKYRQAQKDKAKKQTGGKDQYLDIYWDEDFAKVLVT